MIGDRLNFYYDKFCNYMERDTKGVEVSIMLCIESCFLQKKVIVSQSESVFEIRLEGCNKNCYR